MEPSSRGETTSLMLVIVARLDDIGCDKCGSHDSPVPLIERCQRIAVGLERFKRQIVSKVEYEEYGNEHYAARQDHELFLSIISFLSAGSL